LPETIEREFLFEDQPPGTQNYPDFPIPAPLESLQLACASAEAGSCQTKLISPLHLHWCAVPRIAEKTSLKTSREAASRTAKSYRGLWTRNSSICFSQANVPKHSTHTTLFWYSVGITVIHTSFGILKSPLCGEPHTMQVRGGRNVNRGSPSFI
jgi:hypothetical protein